MINIFDFEKFKNTKTNNTFDHNYLIELISNGIKNYKQFVKTNRLIKAENDTLLTTCGFNVVEPTDQYEVIYPN